MEPLLALLNFDLPLPGSELGYPELLSGVQPFVLWGGLWCESGQQSVPFSCS